jgi:DNA repair protein RadC
VDPYDVIREVLLRGARRFVVAHNHPDCSEIASEDDLILTKELIRLANAIKIPIDDHIIVWDDGSDMLGYISMRMKKIINFEEE